MNELTKELFYFLADHGQMDEDCVERSAAYLTALLSLPYLDNREKKNAGILIDFMESMPESDTLALMLRAARAKLAFEGAPVWEVKFPENYLVEVGGELLSPEDLRRRGIMYVDFRLTKPVRESMEYSVTRRLYADGHAELFPDYQVYDKLPVGERHVFNVYGEKATRYKYTEDCEEGL